MAAWRGRGLLAGLFAAGVAAPFVSTPAAVLIGAVAGLLVCLVHLPGRAWRMATSGRRRGRLWRERASGADRAGPLCPWPRRAGMERRRAARVPGHRGTGRHGPVAGGRLRGRSSPTGGPTHRRRGDLPVGAAARPWSSWSSPVRGPSRRTGPGEQPGAASQSPTDAPGPASRRPPLAHGTGAGGGGGRHWPVRAPALPTRPLW